MTEAEKLYREVVENATALNAEQFVTTGKHLDQLNAMLAALLKRIKVLEEK